MRSSLISSSLFKSRHLPDCAWDALKAVQEYRPPRANLLVNTFANHHKHRPDDDTCPIMDLSDELLLLVFEHVEFSPKNYTSVACVNRRFNNLLHDSLIGYHVARLQFLPYTKLVEGAWREKKQKSNASMTLLHEVYNMHQIDAETIELLQKYSGHSSKVCMTLIALLKTVMSEFPRAPRNATRTDLVDPLERHRIMLFRILFARAYLSPEALVLLRYTVETIRQGISRQAARLARAGWLTPEPPLDFSYYCFFEDCVFRSHNSFVWKLPIFGPGQSLVDHLERVDIFAKMYERQECFLGHDPTDYEDDITWAAMMIMHHEWCRALWEDLTAEQKKMVQQQALLSPLPEEEKAECQHFEFDVYEGGILQIGNVNLVDDGAGLSTAGLDPVDDGVGLHLGSLGLTGSDLDAASTQVLPTSTHSLRLYKTDEVHEHLMLLTRTKYGNKECMEKALDNLDAVRIRDKMRKGREMVWSMNLEECMQAVAREVESSDLRYWLTGSMS